MKVENVLANSAAPTVVWISGAACTGCTMSLLNSVFYTTVDDLLLNRINLAYLDTAMATAGAYVNGVQAPGDSNSLKVVQDIYAGAATTANYVLVVEGAIPCADPTGVNASAGDYCRIGSLTGVGANETMLYNVRALASRAIAVLAVGTCSSFGGIPGARGNVTDARGCLYKGTSSIKSKVNVNGVKINYGFGALNDPALGNKTGAALTTGLVPTGTATGGIDDLGVINKPVINISGCPPHPDWIVGTIAHILDTNLQEFPAVSSYNRPTDYGYKEYQCNAGPCPWRYNNTAMRKYNNTDTTNSLTITEPDANRRYPIGDSRSLGKYKWGLKPGSGTGAGDTAGTLAMGCLGILGCKGRKTKADCSRRRWNADAAENYGVNWCVGSRGGCQGCTEPAFPDKVGKFYTFV